MIKLPGNTASLKSLVCSVKSLDRGEEYFLSWLGLMFTATPISFKERFSPSLCKCKMTFSMLYPPGESTFAARTHTACSFSTQINGDHHGRR